MRETRSTMNKPTADKDGRDSERRSGRFGRKKNPLAEAKITEVTFKDVTLLKYFVSERGRILPRRMTGVSSKQQRMLAKAIKQARGLALLPTLKHD
jgi:small subunit ribosomal protein S18